MQRFFWKFTCKCEFEFFVHFQVFLVSLFGYASIFNYDALIFSLFFQLKYKVKNKIHNTLQGIMYLDASYIMSLVYQTSVLIIKKVHMESC